MACRSGYLAVAPELYQRQGSPSQISDIAGIMVRLRFQTHNLLVPVGDSWT